MRRIFGFLWRCIDLARRIVFNAIFVALLAGALAALFFSGGGAVPAGAALVLDPSGDIVEQLRYVPPAALLFERALDQEEKRETLLRDLIEAIDAARDDERIAALVLELKKMDGAGTSKLQAIGAALLRFKESGKPIVALGDYYTQNQYYLAAHADEVYLHPLGGVLLRGYGLYRLYFKEALEKLRAQVHIFRVGTYKSALEPFERNDMSPQAREANLSWLSDLWRAYSHDVSALRGLEADAIDDYVNGLASHLRNAGGDPGRLALEKGLVDGLKTREEMRRRLIELVGKDEKDESFKRIDFAKYLELTRSSSLISNPLAAKIGVIVARGFMMDGEQPAGLIGGDSVAELFRRARRNAQIKALVLRIDSGGGSAFAAEVIRRQVELTQDEGKPVVVSMGSVAASGGYWVAAPAAEIWAAPTTITGSIGIYGALPTFEKSLEALGVHSDGVGTTRLADAYDPSRPLNPVLAAAAQQLVERGYRRFVELVAEGRSMSPQEVDKIAQGHVWAGARALELGLVDHLGGLPQAIEAAARRAGLEEYEVMYLKKPLSAREKLVERLSGHLAALLKRRAAAPLARLFGAIEHLAAQGGRLNDPQGLYAHCPVCELE